MIPVNPLPDPKNKKAFDLVRKAVVEYHNGMPFVIGITGAGGAGKTTFGKNIEKYFGKENCESIDLDDYLLNREERGKLEVTGYNPQARNKLALARINILDLKQGRLIVKPRYNHSNGNYLPGEEIPPRRLIIIEGVTTLYKELAELNDVSFFLDASEETQLQSRLKRDVGERGYTLEQAKAMIENIRPDYKKYIEPTKRRASVIFFVGPDYIMQPIHIDPKFKD